MKNGHSGTKFEIEFDRLKKVDEFLSIFFFLTKGEIKGNLNLYHDNGGEVE